MNRIARWARQFGVARAVCLLLLLALVPLRLADPRPLRGIAAAHFRSSFRCCGPREQTIAAGRHRRYRRGKPQIDRAVAVAAHHLRRPCRRALPSSARIAIGFDVIFAEPDRMSPASRSRAFAVSTRKPAPSSTACRATTTFSPMRSNTPTSLSARSAAATPTPRTEAECGAADRICRSRTRSGAVSGDLPRSAAQRTGDRASGRRPRPVLDQSGARRHHSPRAGGDGGARRRWCRR